MPIHQVEMNTIITFLGMLFATIQGITGFYAAYIRKRTVLLKTNEVLSQSHHVFGSFATILYGLGLFAGVNGLIGALTRNEPPLELRSASFNIHTWGSFVVLAIVVWKTYLSYFNKKLLYKKRTWLGIAMFAAWSFNWLSAAVSYYQRTVPPNKQHPDPVFLMPYNWMWLQLMLPFILGGILGIVNVQRAVKKEKTSKRR
jgi:hypothetical protein